ncbi:MAG: SH3 domain-containing protein [Devosiaceae bacterium]|nr:SH3 domain-containing protein [Devosiaceae bacterium]
MNIKKITKSLIGLGAALFIIAPAIISSPALAVLHIDDNSSAIATLALNVRTGPGTEYSVVDTLSAGEGVSVNQCANDWCYIAGEGATGWVAQRFLRFGKPPTPSLQPSPPVTLPQAGQNWPDGQFNNSQNAPQNTLQNNVRNSIQNSIQNNAQNDPWPGPAVPWPFQPWQGEPQKNQNPARPQFNFPQTGANERKDQACFYDGANFGGQSTCINSGRSFERLGPRWNDKISSMQVFPNATVTLCQDANYRGNCATFNRNNPNLGPQFNNQASSIMVD